MPSNQPIGLRWRSSTRLIITTICLSIFTDGFLYAVIIPILPFALIENSGVSPEHVQQWESYLLTAYGGAQFLCSPLIGWLADRTTSRKWPFLAGLLVQLLSVLLFLVAEPTAYVLLAARLLGGVSAAVVFSIGLALLVDTVGQHRLGQDAGFVFFSNNIGVLIAPTLGGLVYANAGYIAVISMMCGLVAFDLLLRVVMIEKKFGIKKYDIEASDGTTSQSQHSPRHNDDDDLYNEVDTPEPEEPDEGSPLLHKPVEVSHTTSILPPFVRLLGSFRVLTDCYVLFVGYLILSAFDAGLPLFVKETLDWDSKGAGLIFLTIALPSLGSPIAGYFSDRFGARLIVIPGLLIVGISSILLRLITKNDTAQVVGLCILMTAIGCGLACVFPCMADDLTNSAIDMEKANPGSMGTNGAYAQTFSLYNAGIAAGTVVGPLWMSYAVPQQGWACATTVLGALTLSAAVPAFIFSAPVKTSDNEQHA